MKKSLITIFFCVAGLMASRAQQADVLKSDAISAESQEQYADAARLFMEAHKAYQAENAVDTTCVYRAGMNYVKIEQFAEAVPLLEETLGLNYNVARASRLLADAYTGLKQTDKAEAILLKGKELAPEDSIEFDKKLAYLYFNGAKYDKAADTFRGVNAAVPGNKNYMYLYGFSLERVKKYDEAIAVFEAMQEQFPGDNRSKKMLGVTLFEKTDMANEKAVKQYENNKNANLEDYVHTKNRLEAINQGYEKARTLLEESLVEYPTDQLIISSLYTLYKKQYKEDKAAQMKKRLQQ